ncbi:hypothetical protein AAVH_26325 [Aphelenchoides avenae]|nr:hypothetical protein AAVH_26325 [Aphelenchus avenae]
MVELLPQSGVDTNTSTYEFRVHSDNRWLDLSKTYLYLQLQVLKKNGNAYVPLHATNDAEVSVVQSLGQSFVQQLKLSINGTEVYDSTKLYPYVSYIKSLLQCSPVVKETSLAFSGYFEDTKKQDKTSNGWMTRQDLIEGGKLCEFRSRLDFDLANQSLYLLNNLDVVFKIYRNTDKFLVHSLRGAAPHVDPNEYHVQVHKIRLHVKAVDVQSSLNLAIMKTLANTSAKYPMRRTAAQSWFLTPGRREYTQNVFTNIIPRTFICAMVAGRAYDGEYNLDGFNFEHFNVENVNVIAGGVSFPTVPYNMNWVQEHAVWARPYMDMLEAYAITPNVTNGIRPSQFWQGWSIFVIRLNPSLEDEEGFELVRNGTTTLSLKFSQEVPAGGVEVICIGEFDQILSIDQNRIVLSDGTV